MTFYIQVSGGGGGGSGGGGGGGSSSGGGGVGTNSSYPTTVFACKHCGYVGGGAGVVLNISMTMSAKQPMKSQINELEPVVH